MRKWLLWLVPPALAILLIVFVVIPGMLFGGGAGDTFLASQAASICKVAPDVQGGTLTAQKVASIAAAAGFPQQELANAVAMSKAESDWNPLAINVNTNGSVDHGLFQINDVNASVLSQGDWRDPLDNAVMAFKIWTQWGNWKAWTTFNSGSYLKYLNPIQANLPGCTPAGTGDCKSGLTDLSQWPNGQIPASALCRLWADSSKSLRSDAAAAFDTLSHAYVMHFMHKPCITDAYRTRAVQETLWVTKPGLAAVPGTSNHGWGVAVDLCDSANIAGSSTDVWLHQNAGAFGWIHPSWAEPSGSKPEPWHWEFAPAR